MDEINVRLIITDQVKLICDTASKSWNKMAEGFVGQNEEFHLMMRWSKALWDGHKTLDVVQIGWQPYLNGSVDNLESKPKRSASTLWNILESYAKENGRILRVECVFSDSLINMLIKERGYTPQTYDPKSLLYLR